MRLFLGQFAVIDDLGDIHRRLAPRLIGNWVSKENLHLTLAFLGEVQRAEPVIDALEGIAPLKRPLPLKGVGLFGHPPLVLFAGVDDPKGELMRLYRDIHKRLAFPGSGRRFSPHVTLARIKRLIAADRPIDTAYWDGRRLGNVSPVLSLIRSRLGPEGPSYETLATWGED